MKVMCPFCDGDGCCNCDHSGHVPIGEGCVFKSVDEARNHDPGISIHDLQIMRGERSIETGKFYNLTDGKPF